MYNTLLYSHINIYLIYGDFMKIVGYVLLGLVCITALTFFLGGLNLATHAVFSPANTAIDNKVFHQSQQYNDGMIRDLENLRMAYLQADDSGKAALKGTIIHRFSIYPRSSMTPELQSFYDNIINN